MKFGLALSDFLTQCYWQGAQAMIDGRAAFLLSGDACVLHVNTAAERLISECRGLIYRKGRLICPQTTSNEKLQLLITAALSLADPQGGLARLECGTENEPLFAEVFPVRRSRQAMMDSKAAALLVINSRHAAVAPDIDDLIAAFDLTLAEARVATHLVVGRADDVIAESLGIAISTVRSHVKAVLAKTDTRSKAEVAHLLTRLFHQSPQY